MEPHAAAPDTSAAPNAAAQRAFAWTDALFLLTLAAVCALCLTWLPYAPFHRLGDDAYITMAYARNILRGEGFVFNADGPPVLGTTTPLWTLVLAAAGYVAGEQHIEGLAVYLGIFAVVLTPWVLLAFRRAVGLSIGEAALVGAMMVAGSRRFMLGGEGPLLLLLLVLTLGLSCARRWFLTGIALGLFFLTRGEGALYAPIAAVELLLQHRDTLRARAFRPACRDATRLAAGASLIVAPWLLYAQFTFGRILPNTLDVKMQQGAWYANAVGGKLFFAGLIEELETWFSTPWLIDVGMPWVPILFILLGLAYAAAVRRHLLALVAWCGLYTLGYSLLGVPFFYVWYRAPVLFGLAAFAGLGLATVLALLSRAPRQWRMPGTVTACVLAVIVVLSNALGTWYHSRGFGGNRRAVHYQPLCAWLRAHQQPGDVVACAEIGYLRYFADINVIDLCGLTDPSILRDGRPQPELAVVEERQPRFYVLAAPQPRASIAPELRAGTVTYRRAASFRSDFAGKDLVVYERVAGEATP